MNRKLIGWLLLLNLLGGCATTSISDSGYDARHSGSSNPFYVGELNELDVLGIDPAKAVTEKEITESFATAKKVSTKKGSSIMLIQSGAQFPDDAMMQEMNKYFSVTSFSGLPLSKDKAKETADPSNFSRVLRLAAARGGHEVIVCYWGILETAVREHGSKAISWIPIIGGSITDESQQMRIRLKVAVVDVRTGSWSVYSPEPAENSESSAERNREQSDQKQVAVLKEKAYKAAVSDFLKMYTN